MTEERNINGTEEQNQDESPYEAYGWEFHKKPLMYAFVITVLFYAFIFFYISI